MASVRARSSWIPIALLSFVLVGALIVGRGRPDNTNAARARSIATGVKCMVCQGMSVDKSKAASARLIYAEIERQVEDGRTDSDIRGYLVGRFGKELLLVPESSGAGSVVWIAPVVLTVLAFAGLALVFRRWRKAAVLGSQVDELDDVDRARVNRARAQRAQRVRAGSEAEEAVGSVEGFAGPARPESLETESV
jgi:cytochrome c-type biogenesis protein CcmH